jgi:GAF domain-containing protein
MGRDPTMSEGRERPSSSPQVDDAARVSHARPLREQLLDGIDPSSLTLAGLCRRCAEVLGSTGVSLVLTNDGDTAVAESSDPTAERAADLQSTLGQGPTLDALRLHRAVVTADLGTDERWPELASAAATVGYRAAVAVPLLIDSTQLGALTAYDAEPTIIDGPSVAHAAHVARVLTGILLGLPVHVSTGLAKAISTAAAHQARVHQAAGIISVDEGCSVEEAMVRLRAYAYANERLLADVADAVVGQGLRLR